MALKEQWSGTLVFIGQPAEERGGGAQPMIDAGLFTRFPKPSVALALHVNADLPAGALGLTSGPAMANVDSIDILVRGLGGHGAMPHKSKDPVMLAAQIVVALQTIDSRELSPIEPVVVTVGSIHGGTKHNIIPDEVRLQLTVRTFSMEVRDKVLASIARIARGQAISAGLPENLLPEVKSAETYTPALANDPALVERLRGVFTQLYGADKVRRRLQPLRHDCGQDSALHVLAWRHSSRGDPRSGEKRRAGAESALAFFPPRHRDDVADGDHGDVRSGARGVAAVSGM
jgi:hippurate hydrolase